MNKNKKWLIIAGAILVIVAGVLWFKTRDSGPEYKQIAIKRGDLTLTVLATGAVSPENRLEIKPPVAGRVEQVLVQEGEKVKKGQILAWMSSSERAAMMDAARAQGPAEIKKWEQLYRPTAVIAPLSGTIILRSIESGQTFTATDAILVMSDRLTVKAQVDETDIAKIKLKQEAEISLDAYPDEKIQAEVDQIAFDAKTVNNVTTYVVDVLPKETPEYMRSGMTANVSFQLESKKDVLLIPNEAIKTKNGVSTVLVADAHGRPVETEVKLGLSNGKKTELISGVAPEATLLVEKSGDKKKGSNSSLFSPMGGVKPPKR